MGVIVGPQRGDTGMMERFLSEWMARNQQKKQHRDTLAQNESQFGRSYALDQERTANNTRDTESVIGARESLTNQQRAKMAAEALKVNYDLILKQAGPEKADEYGQGALERYKDNPEVAYAFAGMINKRGRLPIDDENASLAQHGADTAGRVAAGIGSAQDQNFAFQRMTGEQLNAPAFGDARSAQVKTPGVADRGTEYGTSVRMGAGLTPTAGDQLQADTNIRTTAMQVAGQKEIAGMGDGGSGGVGGGGQKLSEGAKTKLAAVNAAYNALDEFETALETYFRTGASQPWSKFVSAMDLNSMRNGVAPLVAKGLGEVGNLSEVEQESAKTLTNPGIVLSTISPEMARNRVKVLRRLFEKTRQGLIASGGGATMMTAGQGQQPTGGLIDSFLNKHGY